MGVNGVAVKFAAIFGLFHTEQLLPIHPWLSVCASLLDWAMV